MNIPPGLTPDRAYEILTISDVVTKDFGDCLLRRRYHFSEELNPLPMKRSFNYFENSLTLQPARDSIL